MTGRPEQPGHDRCGADGRAGKPCGLPAGWGTDHVGVGACRKHLGSTPNHQAHARHVLAERAAERWGLPVQTTAEDALQGELDRTLGRVLALAAIVTSLPEEALVWGEQTRTVRTTAGGDGGAATETTVTHKAAVPVWSLHERWERKHLAEVGHVMISTSTADRALAISERLGTRLADALEAALTGAGVPAVTRARVLELLPGALGGPGDG